VSTLVVAAYPPELGSSTGRAVGVGLVAAAAGTERALAEERPTRLILVGTAGALPGSGLTIGSIVVVTRALLIVRPGEYLPAILSSSVDADEAFAAGCARRLSAPLVTAASGIGITASDEEAARLAATAQIEHLESFAVLSVARNRVVATAVLVIANDVGSAAQAQWRANRERAEAAALVAVASLI
jgi:nucleoside phosphorylase